jgi:hypothetical protein
MTDVKYHPSDNNRAVAASGSGGAWYTTDAGVTWTAATGLPAAGRIELEYAASDGNIVYANVAPQNTSATGGELWKSSDGGASYSAVNNNTAFLGSQGWIHTAIWVDPTNANNLLVAGLDIYRSTDGGTTLTKISRWQSSPPSPHADHRVIESPPNFDGSNIKAVYNGNDGGIYTTADYSTATETAGWQALNNNLGITQFYSIAANSQGIAVGGTPDNGTIRYAGDPLRWTPMEGGDGGYVAADPTDPKYLYGEYVYLMIHRSPNGGNWRAEDIYGQYYNWNGSAWQKLARDNPLNDALQQQANFIAPFILDPNDANRILAGGAALWRTNNAKAANSAGGPTWASIKASAGSNISAIAVASGNSDIIFVGHNSGDLYKTTNGTAETPTWTKIDDGAPALPNRTATRVTVDPQNSNIVYATFGGFSADNVWRSTDGGTTWAQAVGSGRRVLPALPVYSLAVNPSNSAWLYLGTELGVFTSEDSGANWTLPNDGPANVRVTELTFVGNTLYAATFGRGAYKAAIGGGTPPTCYTLTVTVTPSNGSVVQSPPPNCENGTKYSSGTSVSLLATPNAGFGFEGYSGAVTATTTSARVTMDADKTVTATFSISPACYTLTTVATPSNGGSVSANPTPNCNNNTQYTAGTNVILTATPDGSNTFGNWSGGGAKGTQTTASVTMDVAKTITATFALPANNDDDQSAYEINYEEAVALQAALAQGDTITQTLTIRTNTSNASNAEDDPETCEAGKGGKTVWYKLTPQRDGTLTIDTRGASHDTVISVFTGSPGNLTPIECDDDSEDEGAEFDDEEFFDEDDPDNFDDLFDFEEFFDEEEEDVSEDQLSTLTIDVSRGVTYYILVADASEPEDFSQTEIEPIVGRPTNLADEPSGGLLTLRTTLVFGPSRVLLPVVIR